MSRLSDFAQHVERLRGLPQHSDRVLRNLFERNKPIHIARAPGRLDVMGGIGDYSGSLVLELPIVEAAFAAVQPSADGDICIASLQAHGPTRTTTIRRDDWQHLRSNGFDAVRRFFAADANTSWAAYIAGPILVLLGETPSKFNGGLRILIDSQVPEGKGVSSSAAIEVATMRAIAAALHVSVDGETLARLCQLAENEIVGAPSGIMDQMTSALGRKNQLLALRCQPAIIEGFVALPPDVALWGIDSGIRHAVSGSDYRSVRCGAFMGYRMIARAANFPAKIAPDRSGTILIDERWHGYLANIRPAEFEEQFAALIPEHISGAEFRTRYSGTTDRATRIDHDRSYAVLAPTRHPIYENERAKRFHTLLQELVDDSSLREMGQLMYDAHDSYTACGLGSDGTDLLVELVRESGPATGLYGAKITGGGSGGAVAILGRSGAGDSVDAITHRYAEITGRPTYVFRGSSPGAYSTPAQQVVI